MLRVRTKSTFLVREFTILDIFRDLINFNKRLHEASFYSKEIRWANALLDLLYGKEIAENLRLELVKKKYIDHHPNITKTGMDFLKGILSPRIEYFIYRYKSKLDAADVKRINTYNALSDDQLELHPIDNLNIIGYGMDFKGNNDLLVAYLRLLHKELSDPDATNMNLAVRHELAFMIPILSDISVSIKDRVLWVIQKEIDAYTGSNEASKMPVDDKVASEKPKRFRIILPQEV